MSPYEKRAAQLRAVQGPHYNCAQSVFIPFAEKAGMDPETAYRIPAQFGGGMHIGSVCGAVTGGLMALGLFGKGDEETCLAFVEAIRKNHSGCQDCADLLRMNEEKGLPKKPHCDAIVLEAVRLVQEMAGLS